MTEIKMAKTDLLDMIVGGTLNVTATIVYSKKKKLPIGGSLYSHPLKDGWYVLTAETCNFEFDGTKAYFINVNRPSFHIHRDNFEAAPDGDL
jgi:hypothetical protein